MAKKKLLRPEIITAIKNDVDLKGRIASITERSFYTIDRWLIANNPALTRSDIVAEIGRKLKLKRSQIIEEFEMSDPVSLA